MSSADQNERSSGLIVEETIHGFPVHPAATVYSLLTGAEREGFVESVRNAGRVFVPVVFKDGLLVDGRNRLLAVEEIKKTTGQDVTWDRVEYDPAWGDIYDWVRMKNGDRRHLTVDQVAAAAYALHNMAEREAAENRKKQTQYSSESAAGAVTPNAGPPVKPPSDRSGGPPVGKIEIRKRNPTSAEVIAKKAGKGVKKHHIEDLRKIEKTAGSAAGREIRDGTKTIREVVKEITPPKQKPDPPVEETVKTWWERLKKRIPVADLPDARRIALKTIQAERAESDGVGQKGGKR